EAARGLRDGHANHGVIPSRLGTSLGCILLRRRLPSQSRYRDWSPLRSTADGGTLQSRGGALPYRELSPSGIDGPPLMPSRPVTALTVLFWLGPLGWFGYREIWPKLLPGDAPPFVIELADEATSQIAMPDKLRSADALWNLYRDNEPKPIGIAQTR